MQQKHEVPPIPQYNLMKILLVWAAAAIPMGILGWFVAPALGLNSDKPGYVRLAMLTIGLIWQFILAMFLLYLETGNLRWSTIRQRLWLVMPRSPKTGQPQDRLWWWLVPAIILLTLWQMLASGIVDKAWVGLFPFFAEPPSFSFAGMLNTPEARSQLVGAWDLFGLFLLNALFNTFLGEELLFHGILLPRMTGVFGKWDWVMNGVLFGLHHIHQPWNLITDMIVAILFFALPTRYFRSCWFGIIAHSAQSVLFAFIILGIVLGLV